MTMTHSPSSAQSGELPTVARLYYTGLGNRRYKRASTRSGPGEPLCFVSVAEERLKVARATAEYWKAEHNAANERIAELEARAAASAQASGQAAEELKAGIAKEFEAQYELGAWNALAIAWSAIGELPDNLFCGSGKASVRDAIRAIQEQYKS